MSTDSWAVEAAGLRARAARLAGAADALEDALQAVERQVAALVWAGPAREAFVDALRTRAAELTAAAGALRAEAERLAREAAGCEWRAEWPP